MHLSKMLKNAQVGALGTKIYVCGGTDDSWTAHATVEVGFSITMMKTMIMRQRKAKSLIVIFSVSTQALDTITGLWQTLPDLLVPRLIITPYYYLAHLGYHGLSTLVILITLLILLINVLWHLFLISWCQG